MKSLIAAIAISAVIHPALAETEATAEVCSKFKQGELHKRAFVRFSDDGPYYTNIEFDERYVHPVGPCFPQGMPCPPENNLDVDIDLDTGLPVSPDTRASIWLGIVSTLPGMPTSTNLYGYSKPQELGGGPFIVLPDGRKVAVPTNFKISDEDYYGYKKLVFPDGKAGYLKEYEIYVLEENESINEILKCRNSPYAINHCDLILNKDDLNIIVEFNKNNINVIDNIKKIYIDFINCIFLKEGI